MPLRLPRSTYCTTSQEVAFADELTAFTLEVIAKCFLGDKVDDQTTMHAIMRDIAELAGGVFSVPRRFPWPLTKLSAFRFGPSMDARERLNRLFGSIIKERRAALAKCAPGERAAGGGVLDSMIRMQQEQERAGGPAKGELLMDDQYLLDNVSEKKKVAVGGGPPPLPLM